MSLRYNSRTSTCLSATGGPLAPPTFPRPAPTLAQLLVLDEAGEHLGLHEELQELPHAAGRVRLAEGVALQLAGAGRRLGHVQRVVAHQLHEETHEGLRHQSAQLLAAVWGRAAGTPGLDGGGVVGKFTLHRS